MKSKLLILSLALISFFSCAGNKADAQLQAAECDIMFEYHYVENDSISIMVGNTIRFHTGKTESQDFYPLLLSERNVTNLDIPISSEVFKNIDEFIVYLKAKFPFHGTIGVLIGENTSTDTKFNKDEAISRVKEIAKSLGANQIFIFADKNAEIISMTVESL
ncbi:MAG: hypothetical protein GX801_04850 [Fibrobacter sp.]|nr:hypothetical protein [Fibrobacter sp.]